MRCNADECGGVRVKWCNWELGETNLCPEPRVFKEASRRRGGLSYGRFELRTGLHNERGLLAGVKACLEAEPTRLRTTAYKPAASPCTPCSPRRRGCFLQVCGYLGASSRPRLLLRVYCCAFNSFGRVCLLFHTSTRMVRHFE